MPLKATRVQLLFLGGDDYPHPYTIIVHLHLSPSAPWPCGRSMVEAFDLLACLWYVICCVLLIIVDGGEHLSECISHVAVLTLDPSARRKYVFGQFHLGRIPDKWDLAFAWRVFWARKVGHYFQLPILLGNNTLHKKPSLIATSAYDHNKTNHVCCSSGVYT